MISPIAIDIAAHAATTTNETLCTGARWPVKTLTDPRARSITPFPHQTRIEALRRLTKPRTTRRSPRSVGVETTTYTTTALLRFMRKEPDGDIHLVISDPASGHTMIVEFPDPRCTTHSRYRTRIDTARRALQTACGRATTKGHELRGRVTLTGIGFFDLLHGQTGVAPNGIELHPVTSFTGPSQQT